MTATQLFYWMTMPSYGYYIFFSNTWLLLIQISFYFMEPALKTLHFLHGTCGHARGWFCNGVTAWSRWSWGFGQSKNWPLSCVPHASEALVRQYLTVDQPFIIQIHVQILEHVTGSLPRCRNEDFCVEHVKIRHLDLFCYTMSQLVLKIHYLLI